MNRLRRWSVAAGVVALGVLASIRFVDEPVARLSYAAFGQSQFFRRFVDAPHLFGPLASLVVVAFLARRLLGRPFSDADAALVLCAVSEAVTAALLFPLKHLFGRTWPLYGRPNLLIDGVSGFNFFRSGSNYAAFPSGHMAAVSAIAGVLWVAYPKLRPLWAAIVAAAAIPLVTGDFHFVSDVLAGGLLGASASALCVLTFGRGALRISGSENRR